jgi:hypothetical protein
MTKMEVKKSVWTVPVSVELLKRYHFCPIFGVLKSRFKDTSRIYRGKN